jgi:nicotinate-nucleotide pyrophosphorylase (carboxylating)
MKMNDHINMALKEDCYKKDITTNLVPLKNKCKAIIKIKENSHVYGLKWLKQVFKQVDEQIKFKTYIKDGDYVKKNRIIIELYGSNHSLLKGERVALNYLQAMSGTYDLCKKFQKKLRNKNIKLLHTRKTLPLYKAPLLESCKAAGCHPHRKDLSSAILIKENHLKFMDNPNEIISKAIKNNKIVVVEAKTIKFAKTLDQLNINRIFLDNFNPSMLKKIIKYKLKSKLEISGSVNLKNINNFAIKGVDYISIGALTKNIESKDFSMLIV